MNHDQRHEAYRAARKSEGVMYCEQCGDETRARNTLGDRGGPLCGPCKRHDQWRARTLKGKPQECPKCSDFDFALADDRLWECQMCGYRVRER